MTVMKLAVMSGVNTAVMIVIEKAARSSINENAKVSLWSDKERQD